MSVAAKHLYIREQSRRRRMSNVDPLVRLALAACRSAQQDNSVRIAQPFQAAPESRRHTAVIWVLHHRSKPAVPDQTAALATELEFVAAVVDRPRIICLHKNAAVDLRDELLEGGRTGLDIEIGHAIDRRAIPVAGARIGHTGYVGARLAKTAAECPLQHAVANQITALRALAGIVIGVAGSFSRNVRVEGDIQQLRTIAVSAEHVR